MAVTIDITVTGKGNLTFDFTNKRITADIGFDDLTAQELANAIRDAEDELHSETFDKIADMTGKGFLGSGKTTGILIELLEWDIVSAKTSGSFIVKDGSVVETTAGVNIFGLNNLCSQINMVEVNGIIFTTGGSALTTEEHNKLFENNEVVKDTNDMVLWKQ